jgi:hypothetical protein
MISALKSKKASTMADNTPAFTPSQSRLTQFGLTTLYALLELLVSLALGALGALIILDLVTRALVRGSIWGEVCAPRDRVGLEIFRS